MLESLLFQDAPSASIRVVYGVSFLGVAVLGVLEVAGKHLQYSKFWNSGKSSQILIPSRIGMLCLYTPALLTAISSFAVFPDAGIRFLLLKSALAIHFLKRDLEVLFIHKFSGSIVLETVILILTSYFYIVASILYFQHRTQGSTEPLIDLKYLGLLVFLVGSCGNFYHHYLLSKLRKGGEKGYKIPRGGLFNLVVCPHYLFEIFTFIGFAFIAQTTFTWLCALGIALYLSGRSYATRKWYLLKFKDFPKNVKALIPYVF